MQVCSRLADTLPKTDRRVILLVLVVRLGSFTLVKRNCDFLVPDGQKKVQSQQEGVQKPMNSVQIPQFPAVMDNFNSKSLTVNYFQSSATNCATASSHGNPLVHF